MGKKKGSGKKKAQKATSNVFALFSQSQIHEFKEAFNMIDQDRNGFISKEDLAGMFSSMGKDPPETYLEEMIKEQDVDDAGNFDYIEFTRLIKHGPREEE